MPLSCGNLYKRRLKINFYNHYKKILDFCTNVRVEVALSLILDKDYP